VSAAGRPVALITGASAGIGASLARCFARGGHDLVLVARRKSLLDELADSIEREHAVRADVIRLDLLRRQAARELFEALGDRRVDVLVNNAGVYEVTRFAEMPVERVERMVQLNVVAAANLSRLVVPGMVERGAGRILNVASVAGFQAVPYLSLYAATKAFLVSLTEGLAEELKGSGVTVTALCPGVTATEGFESAKQGSADVARVPRWAVSDEDAVAREGYDACMAGEVLRVPGVLNQVLTGSNRVPRTLARMVGGAMSRRFYKR
jgi:hypothetical protein